MSKKTKTLKTLCMKNVIPKEKLSVEECKLKTENWRNYRKKEVETISDSFLDVLEIDESLIDGVDEKIGEIGQKIQLRLKETVFKKSFRDHYIAITSTHVYGQVCLHICRSRSDEDWGMDLGTWVRGVD